MRNVGNSAISDCLRCVADGEYYTVIIEYLFLTLRMKHCILLKFNTFGIYNINMIKGIV